jgi:hypothetical protein
MPAPRTAAPAAGSSRPPVARDFAPSERQATAGLDAAPVRGREPETAPAAPAAPAPSVRAVQKPATDVPAPVAAQPHVLADAAPNAAPRPVPLELNLVTERWDDLIQRVRGSGRAVLADALENGMPAAVSAKWGGELTFQQDVPNPFHAQVIDEKASEVLAILREWFTGLARISVSAQGQAEAPKRVTDEMIRSDRLAKLRAQSPVLGAAIDVLDLDVVD